MQFIFYKKHNNLSYGNHHEKLFYGIKNSRVLRIADKYFR